MTSAIDAAAPATPPVLLTPEEIDTTIETYETAVADLAVLTRRASELKAALVAQVEQYGQAHAGKSKRWQGLLKSATLTYSTTSSVNVPGVNKLWDYLASKNLDWLFTRFFEKRVPAVYVPPPPSYRQVDGPGVVFLALAESGAKKLGTTIENKIAGLVALAIDTKTNQPSLKIVSSN
jgi:hypothetical protein